MASANNQVSIIEKVFQTFKYIFKPGFLVYILAYAITAMLIPFLGQIAILPIFIAMLALMYKSFDSAYNIVNGDDSDPSFALAPNISFTTPLKLFLVYFLISFILGTLMMLMMRGMVMSAMQAGGGIPISLIVMMVIIYFAFAVISPAITMLMIQTQSFRQTINPKNWFGFMESFGYGRYFIMIGVLFIVLIALGIIYNLSTLLPVFLALVFASFLTAIMISFQFLYVAYCAREEYPDAGEVDRGISKEVSEDLRMANQAWRAGNKEDAVQSLLLTINNTSDWDTKTPLLNKLFQYYDQMEQPEKKTEWEMKMIEHIAMEDHQNFSRVHAKVKEKLKNGETFKPNLIYPLARLALINRDPTLAVNLTSGFAKKHPNHADIPSNYFVAAKAFKELKRPEQSKKLLTHLIKTYPNDQEISNFKSLLSDVNLKLKAKENLAKVRANKSSAID